MNNIYSKVGAEKFKNISLFFCLFGDIFIAGYIYNRLNNFAAYEKLMNQMGVITGTGERPFDTNFLHEQFQLLINSLVMMLIVGIAFHLLIYIFYFFDKSFARKYVNVLIWVGAIGFFLTGITMIGSAPLLAIGFIAQALFYTYNIFGIKYFNKIEATKK